MEPLGLGKLKKPRRLQMHLGIPASPPPRDASHRCCFAFSVWGFGSLGFRGLGVSSAFLASVRALKLIYRISVGC